MILHFLTIPGIQERWLKLRNLPDHPLYHPAVIPERNNCQSELPVLTGETTFQHILIVYNKACKTRDVNLIFAALVHDICKADSGYWKDYKGVQYWSNPDHPKQAYDLLMNCDDLKYLIWCSNGDYNLVADICLYHQQVKEMTDTTKFARKRGNVLLNYLLAFRELDDMINRY